MVYNVCIKAIANSSFDTSTEAEASAPVVLSLYLEFVMLSSMINVKYRYK